MASKSLKLIFLAFFVVKNKNKYQLDQIYLFWLSVISSYPWAWSPEKHSLLKQIILKVYFQNYEKYDILNVEIESILSKKE